MAPPSDDDGITEEEELHIRQQVVEGLELALDDEISDEYRRELTKTELEKFIYFAILDFQLPLTYSWYLAGAKTAYDSPHPMASISPQEPATPAHRDPGGFQDTEPDRNPDVERYREYFRTTTFFDDYDLREVHFTSNAEFLCDFYEEFADAKYTDLYIHSTQLREKLKNLDESIDRGSDEEALSQWGGGTDDGLLSPHKEEDIRRLVSSVHMDLAQMDGFDATRVPVTQGTDVIEGVLAKLTHLSELTESQSELVNGLGDFFYHYVWKYPALQISVETASGPNAEAREREHQLLFDRFDEVLRSRIDKLTTEHQEAGLETTIEEIGTNEDPEAMAYFHSLIQGVVDPTK